jgi:hypothetical protein
MLTSCASNARQPLKSEQPRAGGGNDALTTASQQLRLLQHAPPTPQQTTDGRTVEGKEGNKEKVRGPGRALGLQWLIIWKSWFFGVRGRQLELGGGRVIDPQNSRIIGLLLPGSG